MPATQSHEVADREQIPTAGRILGWAGVMPFAAAALAIHLAPADWQIAARDTLIAYGVIILSFMGGAQWGLAMSRTGRPDAQFAAYAASVAPALAGFAIWPLPPAVALPALAAAFLALLAYDLRTVANGLHRPGTAPCASN